MKTDAETDNSGVQKPSTLRRVGHVGLAFINPFSDLMVIYRTGLKPTLTRVADLREQLRRRSSNLEELTWTQAVQRSGRSVEHLQRTFRRGRLLWWGVMMVTGGLSAALLLMSAAAYAELPSGTLLRAATAALVLTSISAYSVARVIAANFRLWQLKVQRLSVEEHGTFFDYRHECAMWRQVVTIKTSV